MTSPEPYGAGQHAAGSPAPEDDFERAVIDHLYDGVYYVDRARRIRYWNDGAERLTGYGAATVVGQFCYHNLLNHIDAAGTQLCRTGCPLAATMEDGEPREAEVFLRHQAGHRVPVRVRTAPVRRTARRSPTRGGRSPSSAMWRCTTRSPGSRTAVTTRCRCRRESPSWPGTGAGSGC